MEKFSDLLAEIRATKRNLKNVETEITNADGSVTIERRRLNPASIKYDDENGEVCDQGSVDSNVMMERSHLRLRKMGYVVDTHLDLDMPMVSKGVFLGSQDAAMSLDLLRSRNITHILNCACSIPNFFSSSILYFRISVLDLPETDISMYFNLCHVFIRTCVEDDGNVLVHCNAGISRSATVVISYIMRYDAKSLDEALHHVKRLRKKIKPNAGFMLQLKEYEELLKLR